MKITFRIWILLIFVVLSLVSIFSIPPTFTQEGVEVRSVQQNSTIFNSGLRKGMQITSINGKAIKSMQDYSEFFEDFQNLPENQKHRLEITTDQTQIIGLFEKNIIDSVVVQDIPNTRIKTGLDLQGGSRALISAENVRLTEGQLNDLIAVTEQRLNVYGLSDVKIFRVTSSAGNNLMGIEIAGSTPSDLEELVAQQGKFEAKIGNKTVFTGDKKDITHVGRTGQDSLITECFNIEGGSACNFRFVISLSEEAAQRHADITSNLSTNLSSGGRYLSKPIEFYVDDVKTSSLNIGTDLKGKVATQIQISGSEVGTTEQEAFENTEEEMKRLQTILITGSLPFKLQIEKIDRISPKLGEQFTRQILLAAIFAIAAVSLVVFIRYRKIKISFALVMVSLSEVLIILGFASLIGWNLDLPSIAGIIAAIGTGVDSQLVILDESRDKHESIKQRIKKALFIITTAFATTFVALLPLTGLLSFMGIGATSAGLLKGFAITTIIGISVGVLISRPAFADIAKQFEE